MARQNDGRNRPAPFGHSPHDIPVSDSRCVFETRKSSLVTPLSTSNSASIGASRSRNLRDAGAAAANPILIDEVPPSPADSISSRQSNDLRWGEDGFEHNLRFMKTQYEAVVRPLNFEISRLHRERAVHEKDKEMLFQRLEDELEEKDALKKKLRLMENRHLKKRRLKTEIQDAKMKLRRLRERLTCPVCRSASSNVVTKLCGHELCKACFDRWYETQEEVGNRDPDVDPMAAHTCPLCRKVLGRLSRNPDTMKVRLHRSD